MSDDVGLGIQPARPLVGGISQYVSKMHVGLGADPGMAGMAVCRLPTREERLDSCGQVRSQCSDTSKYMSQPVDPGMCLVKERRARVSCSNYWKANAQS